MPLEYFYKFRIVTITHTAFYGLGLNEVNSLVVKSSTSYDLRKSQNVLIDRSNTELGHGSFTLLCIPNKKARNTVTRSRWRKNYF